MKRLLIIALLLCSIAVSAQTKPSAQDTIKALRSQMMPNPVYIMYATHKSKTVRYQAGYQLAGKIFDSKDNMLTDKIILFAIIPREGQKLEPKVYGK